MQKVLQRGSMLTASKCTAAKPITEIYGSLDSANAILLDRGFEPETWPSDFDKPSEAFELVVPLIQACVIAQPQGTFSDTTERVWLGLDLVDKSSPPNSAKGLKPSFCELTPDSANALFEYCSTTSIECILRNTSGMNPLTDVDKETQTIMYTHLAGICSASQEAHLANLPNGTEAQHRLGWDNIAAISEQVIAKNGVRIIKFLERSIPLARNARFDADNADEDFSPKCTNLLRAQDKRMPKAEELWTAKPDDEITKHAGALIQPRFNKWRKNVLARSMHALIAMYKRATLDDTSVHQSDTQSGFHVLGVDFMFARCDTVVALSIADMFPVGTDVANMKGFDLIRDAHELVAEPDSSTAGPDDDIFGMPSLLENAQTISERLLDKEKNMKPQPVSLPHQSNSEPLLETSIKSSTVPQLECRDILLPLIFFEYKCGLLSPAQGMNQARFYLISGVKYLAVIGVTDFPIFAVATVGSRGRLLCAWGKKRTESEDIGIHIADTNCPQWDISNTVEAIRFAVFLVNLRTTHCEALVAKFQAVQESFMEEWKQYDPASTVPSMLKWTTEDQRKEEAYIKLQKRRDKLTAHKELMGFERAQI